jgi:hypothetical protein
MWGETTFQYPPQLALSTNGGAKTTVDCRSPVSVFVPRVRKYVPGSPGTPKTVAIEAGDAMIAIGATFPSILFVPSGENYETTAQTTTRRLVICGDSIISGFNSTDPHTQGCAMLVRGDYPGRVTCAYSGGNQSFHSILVNTFGNNTSALAAALATVADGSTTNEILIQLGVTDFGSTQWTSVATFQTEVQALFTALRAAHATATIWWQTIGTTTLGPNGNAETAAQYRTAVVDALTASGISNAFTIDGTTLYTGAALAGDGVHLTTAGQATYKANLKTALGY